MSRLIEEMRMAGFGDRSARDLTFEYGQWLEANERQDIFAENPDFAQEYHELKDEIQRARRPGFVDEFKGAFGSAVDSMQASGFALGALAAHGAKEIGIPGAEYARDKLIGLMREQEEEAAQYKPSVGSFTEISREHPVEDVARFGTYALGTVAPSIAEAALSGVAGAAIGSAVGSAAPGPGTVGGAVSGALLGLAERRLAQKALSKLLERGARSVTLEQVARALPREAVEAEAKRLATTIGSQAALAASSIGMETGSIYSENPQSPMAAITGGVAAGLLDVVPEAYIASRFFRPGEAVNAAAAQGAKAFVKRFAVEAAKTIPMEGSTEAAQTLIEIAAAKYARGEDPTAFNDQDYRQALNAGLIGSFGGAAMAPVSAFANPSARPDRIPALVDRVVENIPPPPIEEGAGPLEFGMGNEIPEESVAGMGSLPRDIREQFARETADSERFGPRDAAPYQEIPGAPFGAGRATPVAQGINEEIRKAGGTSGAIVGEEPAPALPKSVQSAIDAAESAARAWELSHAANEKDLPPGEQVIPREYPDLPAASPPPERSEMEHLRPQSEVVEDAPLANLIGTTVEYAGYRGQLVRDENGNFLVLPPVRPNSKPFWIEVAGTGKNPSLLASDVGITPTEPANMTPKPAPSVVIPGAPPAGRPPVESKVPLGDLFPSDLVPRQDIILPPNPPAPVPPRRPLPGSGVTQTPAVPQLQTGAASQAPSPTPSTPLPVPAGATNIVEKTPESKLSHDAQVALWKRQNQKTKAAPKRLSYMPDGRPDLLNEIESLGGIAPPKRGEKGGEYDRFYETFAGKYRVLIKKGGPRIENAANALGYNHVPTFIDAVEAAMEQRRKEFAAFKVEQQSNRQLEQQAAQAARFEKAAIQNTSRPKEQAGKPVLVDELGVGDRFKVKREPFEVVYIDPDTGDVIVNDGERFGKQTLKPGTKIYPDKRTLRRIPRDEVSFLDEEDEAPEQKTARSLTEPLTAEEAAQMTAKELNAFFAAASEASGVPRLTPDARAAGAAAKGNPEKIAFLKKQLDDMRAEFKKTLEAGAADTDLGFASQYWADAYDAAIEGPISQADAAMLEKYKHLLEPTPEDPPAPAGGELLGGALPFNLSGGTETPAAPPIPEDNTAEMFPAGDIRSLPPTALDRANAAAREGVANALPPKIEANPTGEQQAARSGNGVPSIPKDSLPNVRRLRIFEAAKAAPEEQPGVLPAIAVAQKPVESGALQENPLVAVDKAVGKRGKGESNVAVIIVDNATGQAYMRSAYRGAANALFFDLASKRRGTVTGQGSTVSLNADFLNGDEGRPAHKLFAEKAENGAPRYSLYGMAELTKPGGPRNWNMGPAAALNANPAIQGAAKAYWTEQAKKKPIKRAEMPKAAADLEVFPLEMAAWRRENPGDAAAELMLARIREYAAEKSKGYGADLTPKKLDDWVEALRGAIEKQAAIEQRQAVALSADYVIAPARSIDIMNSALRALTEGRQVDVAAFEQGLGAAFDSAAKTMGMVVDAGGRKKILAFAVDTLNGPVTSDRVISVLHETAHVVTDGLPEPLRVAFHEAIKELPWQNAGWLMNARSLDIRLLANADINTLSPEQRAALKQLTPQEIAAAKRLDRSTLVEEQMAEHLAQLGWNQAEARSVVQKVIRFVKELAFRLAMAVQQAIKGKEHVSPELARRFVENRFLQFIHRDSAYARDRINDLATWLGLPPSPRQLIPVFPAGNDWEMRMNYIDPATGQMIAVDHSVFTQESQAAYLQAAIVNAQRFADANPPGGPDTPATRFSRRVAFSAPLSFTPTIQANTVFAAVNLEEEIYANIAAHPDIGPLLPVGSDFATEWLKLPDSQTPAARKASAEKWAGDMEDPTTGTKVSFDADTTVDSLPTAEEATTDKEGNPVTVTLTEAQDKALQFAIRAIGDTQRRLQRRINHEVDRIADLERLRKRNPADFPEAALKELDELNESLPLRRKIAEQLVIRKNELISKFAPADLVNIYPTAEYLTIPAPDATEAEIRAAKKGVVPRDLKFTDKTTFAGHLAAMEAWLLNPENRTKGQIYGTISEQFRKLNQIPTNLQRVATAGILRRAITGGFADELRASGLPALQNLGKKFYEVAKVINEHAADVRIAGAAWSEAFGEFAKAMDEQPDQSFKERVYDELMRTWNFIDVSERGKIGTSEEGNFFERIEGAIRERAGIDIRTEKQRAALRKLLLSTIENERVIRLIHENNPGLKVKDEEMGIYRRLVSHGLVTGRRSVARHMAGLFMQMNPVWSDTTPASAEDPRSFWDLADELYEGDRAAFDAKVAELFPANVVRDFAEPIINNNTQIFDVQDEDGIVRKASLIRVRQAWADAGGDIVRFAEILHSLEGGETDTQKTTVASVMRSFRRMFEEIKSDQDAKEGIEKSGVEVLPRQMMDARIANDWPAEWVSYATYNESDNLQLLHQLARSAAFGPDAIAANGELANTIRQSKLDLADVYYRYDEDLRNGMSPADVKRKMGDADFSIAKNAQKIAANLDRVETAFRTMSASTNYLAGDFKLMNDALGFMATMMVQNPRGTAINTSDILGVASALKLSRPALKAVGRAVQTLAADLGNGVLQAFGQNAAFNIDAARRRVRAGIKDSDSYTSWKRKMANMGPGQSLAAPSGYESPMAKTRRLLTRWAVKGRDIIPNLGSPLQGTGEMQTLSPKLRWGGFPNWAMSTMNANIDAAYNVFVDLATRGVDRINEIPAGERARFVRELELGIRDLGHEELGYLPGIVLNDKAAFDSLRFALETKMAGEKSVGAFVAKAYRRMEAAGGGEWDAIGASQFADILNYANTEWTLQNNFASLPPWMQTGPLRPLFIFLTWPYNAMRRFGKGFTDPEGRLIWWGANSTVKDGMMAFFLMAAPATIAGSFAIDWYDKYLLGKRQNLRETHWTTALPGIGAFTDPAAFVERVGRYGSAGLATDILNQIVNYDTQRNLSLDSRIVAVNALTSLVNSLVITPLHQGGNVTYASVARPFFQAIGGGGVLQYLQIANNALDLNTQDAAINARINTGNYLRAAGREINLPVRVARGAAELPTRSTPYLQQMELAALVNNQELFRDAYRNAMAAAREDKKEDPAKYVAENFMERHPLKRIFRVAPTETEYRKLLATMDEYGAGQVRQAINSYNRYLTTMFGKKPYYGKADRTAPTPENLIRSANRINAGSTIGADTFLAIP